MLQSGHGLNQSSVISDQSSIISEQADETDNWSLVTANCSSVLRWHSSSETMLYITQQRVQAWTQLLAANPLFNRLSIGGSIMLAQFRSKYPEGNLISELVQIYHGKYIVRASVQIDGVTRATGMAAAETLEEAEDQARNRALVVLGITSSPQESVVVSAEPANQVKPTPTFTINQVNDTYSPVNSFPQTEVTPTPPAVSSVNSFPKTEGTPTPPAVSSVIGKNDTKNQEFIERFPTDDKQETQFDTPLENLGMISGNQENNTIPEISPSNVTPFGSRSYSSLSEDLGTQTATAKKKKKSEPVDQSDDIAKIGVEMQRLGWTTDQGRDYLIKTYGKRSRHLLSDDELHDFLRYLESQPTPLDPLAGF